MWSCEAKVPASALTKREANKISAVNNDSKKSNETQYVLKIETPVETMVLPMYKRLRQNQGRLVLTKKLFVQNSNNEKVNTKANKKDISVNSSLGNSYSNFIS